MRYTISFLLAAATAVSCTAAAAEVPVVVSDIVPVHALVSQVMGDLGQPVLLLDRGADPHSFQLRPSQARAVADAGLVVWVGPELTPWLDRAVGGLATGSSLKLLERPETHRQAFGSQGGEAADEPEAEAGHDDHGHGGVDPHAWLDPMNAHAWLGIIAADLTRLDPEHAAVYAANGRAAQAGVAALDAEIAALLASIQGRSFVVFHDAYGYFTGHYGLSIAGSVSLGDAVAPGAAHLSELKKIVESSSEKLCLFPEYGHDPKLLEQLAKSGGAVLGGSLDPEGIAAEPGPDAYAAIMSGLAQTLAACVNP